MKGGGKRERDDEQTRIERLVGRMSTPMEKKTLLTHTLRSNTDSDFDQKDTFLFHFYFTNRCQDKMCYPLTDGLLSGLDDGRWGRVYCGDRVKGGNR